MSPDWIPFAFVPVDKPPGPTSFGVVAGVRRCLPRKTKVGHAGTLDPFASGVLLVGVGKATRFMDDVHKQSKSYVAEIKLGVRTDSLDATGEVDLEAAIPAISEELLAQVQQHFLGSQAQMPPAFSAKKVDGQRAYDLARKGQEVKLKPAQIVIHELVLAQKAPDLLLCDVTCSTGTYIRSLGRDIAEALGTVGHLVSLRRTRIGQVSVDACVPLDDISAERIEACALSVPTVVPDITSLRLPELATTYFANGRPLPTSEVWPDDFLGECRDENDKVVAIYRCHFNPATREIQPKAQCYQMAAQ